MKACPHCNCKMEVQNLRGEWFSFMGAKVKVMLDSDMFAPKCLNKLCGDSLLNGSHCKTLDASLSKTVREALERIDVNKAQAAKDAPDV